MCRFGDLAFGDFLQRVDPLATLVESVHEMHCGSVDLKFLLGSG